MLSSSALPGGPYLTVAEVARRAQCSREAIYERVHEGRIRAIQLAGRYVIAEAEADRFIRDWPVRPNGEQVAARWREFRAWKASQAREAAA